MTAAHNFILYKFTLVIMGAFDDDSRMTKSTKLSPVSIGFCFAIGSAIMFAIRPIFVKLVYEQGVDSTTLIALRMLFSVPIYIALLLYFLRDPKLRSRLTEPKSKNTTQLIIQISIVGILGYYFASFLDLLGLQYVTAQLGRMLLYSYPTFVVIFGAIFFGKPITLRTIISLLLTYIGIAVIFGHDFNAFGDNVITGALFILGSAISFSIYLLYSKPLIEQVGSRLFTCLALISASTGIFIHFLITHSITDTTVNNHALLLIILIAIFCTVIPTFFTTAAISRIGADRTGIVAMIGPGFTSIFAVAILNEDFTAYHLAGIALTILGVSVLKRN